MAIDKIVFSPRHVAGCDVPTGHGENLNAMGLDVLYQTIVQHRALPQNLLRYNGDIRLRPRFLLRRNIELVFDTCNKSAFFGPAEFTVDHHRYWTQMVGNNSIKISEAGSHFRLCIR